MRQLEQIENQLCRGRRGRRFGLSRRGTVLLTALLAVTILTMIVGSYLENVTTDYRNAHRQWYWNQALEMAEAGLEIGVSHVQARNMTGWMTIASGVTTVAVPATNPAILTDASGTRIGTAGIAVTNVAGNSNPIVQATGYVTVPPNGQVIMRTVRAILDLQTAGAINAKQVISFTGTNVMVDSYLESLGSYADQVVPGTGHARENGDVLAFSNASPAIDIGNSTVWGEAETAGGTIDMGPGGFISGDQWDGLQGDLNDVTLPAGFPAVDNFSKVGDVDLVGPAPPAPATKYSFRSISLGGTRTLRITGNVEVYVQGDFATYGSAQVLVTPGANLVMYLGSDVHIAGNAVVNQTGSPKNVSLLGLPTSTDWQINGNGTWSGTAYAPNADLQFFGGGVAGDAYGVIGANTVTFTGNTNLHFEETLDIANLLFAFPYKVDAWQEITPPIPTP